MTATNVSVLPEHLPARHGREQSSGEELANSLSHGAGLIAALIGTPYLVINAVSSGSADYVVGISVFCASILFLYLSSTLYHAWVVGKAKRVFRIVEHCAIFVLIAGTYTPLALGVLRGPWGWALLGAVWSLAIAGVTLKAFHQATRPVLFTSLYLVMGWLVVLVVEPLLASMPTAGLLLLLAGGLFYTVGVIFFATDYRLKYGHFIWHLFVILGTVCHYFAVLGYGI